MEFSAIFGMLSLLASHGFGQIAGGQGTFVPAPSCRQVDSGAGPVGSASLRADTVVSGLDTPWAIAFLSNEDFLVTERPGRIRLVRAGSLIARPVATLPVAEGGEGGLLGIALHPQFETNRLFYVDYTFNKNGTRVNRVERYRLSPDATSATPDRIILDDIPAGTIHDGGRLHFGPDGNLYISAGESGQPALAPDPASLGGKLLRVTPEGEIPPDNPEPGRAWFVRGLRNPQGFDWINPSTLMISDNGPTGELGRVGLDEVNVAVAGDSLGWPEFSGCDNREGLIPPVLTWTDPVPPGGAIIYHGNAIPGWDGSALLASTGAQALERVTIDVSQGASKASAPANEVYFQSQYGRLRELIQSPDGTLYATTSNCDGRGTCPEQQDSVLRIRPGS